ncbi:MAG TPA: MATE family efflux transporter [Candidatus Syntrophosphaera sp.]|jgi:putative MATE family efflux protein|nr:MATE family efflux transporter [Candidatus Syntrophosphaera sp.]
MTPKNIHVLEEMPVFRAILNLALPSILSMLVNILYNLTDTFFIGKLNDPVMVAAVSISLPLFTIQMAIAGIFGVGGGSYLSRLLGKKDYQRARETTTTAIFSAIAVSIILTVVGLLTIPLFLKAVGASAATAIPARQYITIILLGSPFVMAKFAMVQLVRAEGSAKQAMYGLFIGTGVNIVLDPLFIFVFNMGVIGAAVATVIGQALGMAYYFYYYRSAHSIARPGRKYLHLRADIYREILLIGFPASLGQVMMSVGSMIAYNLVADYGDLSVAAMGVASRVFSIPIFVFIGLSVGVQALIGFNYGAGNFPRMKKALRTSLQIALSLSVFFTLLFALFPRALIGAFIEDRGIMAIGKRILDAYVFSIPFAAVGMILMGSLQAMGKALPAFIVSLSRQGLLYIPALLILNKLFGFSGLIFAMPLADALTTLISGSFVFSIVSKLKHRVAAPSEVEYVPPVAADGI